MIMVLVNFLLLLLFVVRITCTRRMDQFDGFFVPCVCGRRSHIGTQTHNRRSRLGDDGQCVTGMARGERRVGG